jgi:arsenite methyltransferase
MNKLEVKKRVRETYKKAANSKCGCCSSSCSPVDVPQKIKDIGYSMDELSEIPEEAVLGLGCGNPVAIARLNPGETVLDLGSGAGIDVFLASKKVGEKGRVIGVDMTPEMVDKSRELAIKEGFSNVDFRLGEIEHLPVADNSVDVVISNCVINLSVDKNQVFKEIFRVLRPGGRLAVSDIVLNGTLPDNIKKDLTAWSACISGAVSEKDYLKLIQDSGLSNIKIESRSSFDAGIPGIKDKIVSLRVVSEK